MRLGQQASRCWSRTIICRARHCPLADAIVNPNQPGCLFPDKSLAGVGVMFYVLLALRKQLRDSGWFVKHSVTEPNLAQLLDLVALGTVADVVPLSYTNRTLVQQGLLRIRAGQCCEGVRALAAVSKRVLSRMVTADFGFALAPRLNAAGRLDDMSVGIICLITDDPLLARSCALELDVFNQERRNIEAGMHETALNDPLLQHWAQQDSETLPWSLCLYNSSWHQGVIGILAGVSRNGSIAPLLYLPMLQKPKSRALRVQCPVCIFVMHWTVLLQDTHAFTQQVWWACDGCWVDLAA